MTHLQFAVVVNWKLTCRRLVMSRKISFNPGPSKQVVEVYFTQRLNPPDPLVINYNNAALAIQDQQKHLGEFLPRDSFVMIYCASFFPFCITNVNEWNNLDNVYWIFLIMVVWENVTTYCLFRPEIICFILRK